MSHLSFSHIGCSIANVLRFFRTSAEMLLDSKNLPKFSFRLPSPSLESHHSPRITENSSDSIKIQQKIPQKVCKLRLPCSGDVPKMLTANASSQHYWVRNSSSCRRRRLPSPLPRKRSAAVAAAPPRLRSARPPAHPERRAPRGHCQPSMKPTMTGTGLKSSEAQDAAS